MVDSRAHVQAGGFGRGPQDLTPQPQGGEWPIRVMQSVLLQASRA